MLNPESPLPSLRSLEPEQLGDVINAMFERSVEDGDYIIKQGDDGDNFYVIEK